MSIEAALHQRWTGYKPLVDLVPSLRIGTGDLPVQYEGEDELVLPYVTMERTGEADVLTPSGGITLETLTITVAVYATSLDGAKEVARLVETKSKGKFDYEEGRVLDMRKTGGSESEQDDGSWKIETDYQVMTQEP